MEKFEKFIGPGIVIIAAVGLRLLPHMPNFAPIGALALFGGAYLDRRWALLLPLAAMLVSDFFIGFYSLTVMISVYVSFLLIGLLGMYIRNHKTPRNVVLSALGSSVLFFLLTNFAVWVAGAYSRGFEGLFASYIAAVPFFRGTLMGDLFYTTLFFGGFEFATSLVTKHRISLAKVDN